MSFLPLKSASTFWLSLPSTTKEITCYFTIMTSFIIFIIAIIINS